MIPLSDFLWRGLALLWLTLAPYAAKVEVASAGSGAEASVRIGVALAVLAFLGFALLRLWRRNKLGAAAAGGALVAAFALGSIFRGDRGPLGGGLPWLFPLVWGAIAVIVAGPVADLTALRQGRAAPSRRERLGWAAAALAIGALGLGASWRRVGSPGATLAAAVKSDPGSEALVLRLASSVERSGDPNRAKDLLHACAQANPEACGCIVPVVKAALERGAYVDAGAVLVRADQRCRDRPGVPGMLAETLAGGGEVDAARQATNIALAKNRNDPHALYAKGLLALRAGNEEPALLYLNQAIAAGRGARARVELGLLQYRRGNLAAARSSFETVVRENPRDLPALYNLALIDQVQERYYAAREGYLRVLRLDPRQLDARFNLAVMTQAAGAKDEAKHHLAELEKRAAPDDPRVTKLRKLLQ
ncbi:MAG TPA: tetratricopeptide repeat protein [Polyangiaceae bacterium]